MKVVDRAFKSFFALIIKAKAGSYRFNQIRLPHYLDKEGFFSLILPTAHVTFKNGFFILPMSRIFKKEHCELKFRVPPQIDVSLIKEIRIHPKHKAFFELEFVYRKELIETYKFSGRRITRGQYKSATGIVLNADVNGALNILRKSSLISLVALQDSGEVSTPRRIRIF